jgi:hypothetical protein
MSSCRCCKLSFKLFRRVEYVSVTLILRVGFVTGDFFRNFARDSSHFHFVSGSAPGVVHEPAHIFRIAPAGVVHPKRRSCYNPDSFTRLGGSFGGNSFRMGCIGPVENGVPDGGTHEPATTRWIGLVDGT